MHARTHAHARPGKRSKGVKQKLDGTVVQTDFRPEPQCPTFPVRGAEILPTDYRKTEKY